MKGFLNHVRFGPTIPACFVISLLASTINTTYAAEATDLGTVDANYGSDAAPAVPAAAKTALSQSSLDARSAQSVVGDDFVRNYTSPISDFSQVIQMTPGLYNYSANGVGLGDTKTTFRGFADGNYNMTFDGIPFQDTNGVSHHSWVWFPSQFIGGAVVDRSPGSAATIGQATFNGAINFLSRDLEPQQRTSVTGSYGSWDTKLLSVEHETGQFGQDGRQNLMINAQEMKSDGYQTYNAQQRTAASIKYQNVLTDDTVLTLFVSRLNLKTNTPNTKGPTRAQIAQFGDNYLMSGDPSQANYYGYNFYNIDTDFEYIGITSNLGNGWKLDDKLYSYRYWNKQNYNGTTINATSATDKLNSYRTSGNLLRLSNESAMGTFRTGLWTDYAKSYRYQIPSNPLTWVDAAVPNFNERYQTTTVQPFAEFEFKVTDRLKITPGIKYAFYKQVYTHLADNGGAVGNLGGAASIDNSVTYHDVLPSLDAHYLLQPNWSIYAQYGTGDLIPPTSVFDVPNAQVSTAPKPQYAKSYQTGTVWKSDRYTLDFDVYYTRLDGAYTAISDGSGNVTYYLSGTQISKGIEAEGNVILGGGFNIYLNGTYGSAKYANNNKWVPGAPKDTETLGLTYQRSAWDLGVLAKRVGKTYSDNAKNTSNVINEAFTIDPFTVTNLFANYTLKTPGMFFKQAKLQFGVNNLFNKHNITAVLAAGSATSSSANPSSLDQLALLPGRSVSTSLTLDF
jgi:iron complex outermembrane receptor protein